MVFDMRRRGFVTRWGSSLVTSALFATLLVVGPSAVQVPVNPSAGTTYLCSGYSGCKKAGYKHYGYPKVSHKMFWRMYAGHNCTNYVAYRIIKAGGPRERPWSGGGNASEWGKHLKKITDKVPNVGAVAWWGRYSNGSGSAGHVAMVEQVVSPTEIVISEDSWGGTFHWRRITKSSGRWPTGFIHIVDKAIKAVSRPVISGAPVVGSTLTATAGTWSIAAAHHYQWYAGGVAIPGATRATYAPTSADVGKAIHVVVTATAAGYSPASQASASTAPVAEGTYTLAEPPVITGKPYVDEVLNATVGTWNPQPSFTGYRWYVDGAKVPKSNKPKLKLKPEMLGKTVSVVAVVRGEGFKEGLSPAISAGQVLQDEISVLTPFGVTGRPRYGETLQVAPGTFSPADATVSYQWLRDGVPIAGATGPSYRLGAADAGARVAPRVTLARPTYASVEQTPASPGRTTSPASIKMVTGDRRGQAYVRVKVTAPGVRPVTGKVWIRVGSWRDTVRLTNGKAKVLVPVTRAGKRTVVVRYRGSEVVPRARRTGSVKVG
jgi:surface antigen